MKVKKCGECDAALMDSSGVPFLGKKIVYTDSKSPRWEVECSVCWTINYFPVKGFVHDLEKDEK